MLDVLRRLAALLGPSARWKVLAATAASFVISTLDALAVALVLPLVELAAGTGASSGVVEAVSRVLGTTEPERLTMLLVMLLVALFVLKDLASIALNWWMLGFNFQQRLRLSQFLLNHFLTSPYTQVTRRSSAELIRTMNDAVSNVFNQSLAGAVGVVMNTLSVVAIGVGVMLLAPGPTLATIAYLGLASFLYLKLVKPRALQAGAVMTEQSERAWRHAFAAIFGLRELQLRGTQRVFVDRYSEASETGWRAARTAVFLGSLPRYLLEILFIVAVGLVVIVRSDPSGSTVGLLGLFVAAGFRVLPSVTALLGNLSQVRVGTASLDVVWAEVQQARASRPETVDGASEPPLALANELRLDAVTFAYPGSANNTIDGVTLTIPYGAIVAIVGESGAGKTTLVDLVLGLHHPSSGSITADGVDISTAPAKWRSKLGYVPQDVFLLDASIAENVAFDVDRADIDLDRLADALEQAQLNDVVAGLPGTVDSQVGERGALLSGGQRQRIGIARALFRRPKLLILDEATSALDSETEHRFGQALERLHGSLTVIVVAHRLSTVRNADQIVFLERGRVTSVGTFDEVRRDNPLFARWVALAAVGQEGSVE